MNTKKIAVITATRAEYGLLLPVIKQLRKHENDNFIVELVVTGTHLSESYGMTENEILRDGIRIDKKIQIPTDSDCALDISYNQAETLRSFTDLFGREKYDGIILLGDRYETLAVAIAAGNTCIPIFHLCGGDTTEGAIDEWIRHSITKMSYLHFTTNEDSRHRVIQMGENPKRVFNFGCTSIDNILAESYFSSKDVLDEIGLSKGIKYALCTYHPATMNGLPIEYMVTSLIGAIETFPDIDFIFTKANADVGGSKINALLEENEKKHPNMHLFASFGVKRYLSLMKDCEFVIGNSSSGIVEAPSFRVPTVNIGDRQKGRPRSSSIIDCGTDKTSIIEAIKLAISPDFRRENLSGNNTYGDGHSAKKIAEKIIEAVTDGEIDLRKSFYNIDF